VWSSPVLDGAYWCRNDSHFTLVGSAAGLERMIGYTDEEIRRRFCGHMIDLIHEQDRETAAQEIRRQLQQGTDYILEYRMTHRGGSVIWVTEKGRLVTGEDGQEYIYCALMDTTESRRSYDVLRQQLERYEIILAQTENVLFDWNLRDDTIIFSETWERIFGFKAIRSDVIRSLSTGSYFHPDDLPLLLKGIRELRQGGHYRMTEVRVASGSGRYLWCRFRASAVRGCDGELELSAGEIMGMDWLCDNVEGSIPALEQLRPESVELARLLGIGQKDREDDEDEDTADS